MALSLIKKNKSKPATKAVPLKAPPAKPVVANGKDKKSKKAKKAPTPPPAPPAESSDESSEESSSESSSEDEAPKSKPLPKAAPKANAPSKPAPPPVKKAASDESSDTSSSEEEDEPPKAAQVSQPKKAPVVAKADSSSSEDSDSDSDSEEEVKSKPTPVAKPAPVPTKKVAPAKADAKKAVVPPPKPVVAAKKADSSSSSSSEEDSDDSDDSDEEPKPAVAPKKAAELPKAKPATVVKKAAEESGSESSDSEEDSDDSDEEDSDGDVGMKDAKPSAPVAVNGKGKRKAAEDVPVPAKKAKVESNGATEEGSTIFVGRLSWSVDNDWLKSEFEQFGEVVSARVQMDSSTGKSRGFGYVEFKDAASAKKAIARDGDEIDGRPVNVNMANARAPNPDARAKAFGDVTSPPTSVLFVGNLPWSANEDAVWQLFGDYGSIVSVRLPTDRETGKPKGFGYVEFTELADAQKAFEGLKGHELDGRNLRLDYSQPRSNDGGDRGGRGGGRGGFGDRGGFGGRGGGRGGFGDRRGGFGGDRGGRGGFGGGRGGRGGFGDRGGGRGAPRGRGNPRSGAIVQPAGTKKTFD